MSPTEFSFSSMIDENWSFFEVPITTNDAAIGENRE
jgi:hypothetical protein